MTSSSLFNQATYIPPDPIFALTAEYLDDPFEGKVNLGQGTYRDQHGNPWVLPSVQEARRNLLQEGLNHEYLPILGLEKFRLAAAQLVLGDDLFKDLKNQLAICQSISGTGALHLAGLLFRNACINPPNILIPQPTWSNHRRVFSFLGFSCHSFNYYDPNKKTIDWDSYMEALEHTRPNTVVILHACTQNPTGCDPSQKQWRQIGRIVRERHLFPLFDAAYLGFNSGNLDSDAFAIRHFVQLGIEVGVCLSFAKNMGLYGERVGCFFVVTDSERHASNVQSQLEMLQRSEVSNPPAYGAKIVTAVLGDDRLRQMWYGELITMSERIQSMRLALYRHLIELVAPGPWEHLVQQSGMFGFLGLPYQTVRRLKDQYHIYMAANSRISIAGLNPGNVKYVAESITKCLASSSL